jgi:hypothetical protein
MPIKLNPCVKCGSVPQMAYACGEYFIIGRCEACNGFKIMHSTEEQEAEDWNAANPKKVQRNG